VTGVLDEWAGLSGKVAVITGGAGGLGRPITLDLARLGVEVAVCDRDEAALDEITKLLEGQGTVPLTACFDVRDSDALAAFFASVDERFGRVDILVNVPGGSFRAPMLDIARKGIDAVIRINFTYVVESIQHAAQRMQAQGTGGSIINITTIEGHRAMPMMSIYGAMKAGVAQLCQTLAVELGPDNIRVNAIAPDHFPTPATIEAALNPSYGSDAVGEIGTSVIIPMGRVGNGPDLSGCVVFLASDLSSYVTGTTLHLDGGTMAAAGWMHWPEDGHVNMLPEAAIRSVMET